MPKDILQVGPLQRGRIRPKGPNDLAPNFVDRFRQRVGLVRLAVGRDLCRIALQAVVVQDVAVGGSIVITAHPKADEFSVLRTVPEPISTSDLVHIHTDLSRTWQ
jgi:hypothetical protein